MSKFKVGDKVKLRDDLEVGKEYGKINFLTPMKAFQGKELTIDSINRLGGYTVKGADYFLSEEMFKGVVDDSDLLKFALSKLNITKEELEEEYEKGGCWYEL